MNRNNVDPMNALNRLHADSPAWVRKWLKLWSIEPKDRSLTQLGLGWLEGGHVEHHSWAKIWQTLWATPPRASGLATIAMRWLKEAPPSHRSWLYVWNDLFQACEAKDELLALRFIWLQKAPVDHPSWTYAWRAEWDKQGETASLIRLAEGWLLRARPSDPRWPVMWRKVRRHICEESLGVGDIVIGETSLWTKRSIQVHLNDRIAPAHMPLEVAMTRDPTSWESTIGWKEVLRVESVDGDHTWVVPQDYETESPITGRRYKGLVSSVVDFGIFVATRVGTGVIHHSKIPGSSLGELHLKYQVGRAILVVLESFDAEGRLFFLEDIARS